MAINLPSNLYSGEAERINQLPHIQFQTQLLAHKAAKDAALDDYYRKLPETINDKGTRDQEVPKINQVKNNIQDFYLKNRSAIQNPKLDNGAAQFNLQKMYRDAGALVRESQNRAKTDLLLGKMRFEGDKNYIFQDPELIKKIHAHSLPVGDAGSESIDLANVTVPPKPFNEATYHKDFGDIKWDEGKPIIEKNKDDKYHDIETTPKFLSKDNLNVIHNRAASKFDEDASFNNFIKNTLAKDPNRLAKFDELYQKSFGHPIQNEYDLATAYTLATLPQGAATTKSIDNGLKAKERQQAGFAHADQMQARGFAHQEKVAKEKLGVGTEVNINDIYQNIQDATDNPSAGILQEGKRVGTRVNTLNADAQKVVIDYANKLRPNEKIGNDNIFIHKDTDGTLKLYRTEDVIDENGAVTKKIVKKDDAHLIGELPKVTLNLPAQPSVKEKRVVIGQGNEPTRKKITDLKLLKALNGG